MKIDATFSNGNPGIVPPWLQKPPVIVLPVEPEAPKAIARFTSGERVTSAFSRASGTYVALVDRRTAIVRWDSGLLESVASEQLRQEAGA